MVQSIQLGEISIDVTRKNVRNVNLRVLPPTGTVRISAPRHVKLEDIRAFAAGKLDWIKRARIIIRERKRETPRKYVDDETHFVSGKPCLLKVVERNAPPVVEIKDDRLILYVRPGADRAKKQAVVSCWYRQRVRNQAEQIIARWEPRLGVTISKLYIRQMKTRWGSCNTVAGSIRLNTELGKKPVDCLEYVVVQGTGRFSVPILGGLD